MDKFWCTDCDWDENCSRVKCNIYVSQYEENVGTQIINDILRSVSCHLNDTSLKIFMSTELKNYLIATTKVVLIHNDKKLTWSIFGVPIEVFHGEEYEWWLSWDNHKYLI